MITAKKKAPTGIDAPTPKHSVPASVTNGFTKLDNAVLFSADVSHGALRLYGTLRHHQGSNAECWPGQKTLAAELCVSVRQVQRYLKELERARLAQTRQIGLRRTNRYRVLNPDCAAIPVNITEATSMSLPIGSKNQKEEPSGSSSSFMPAALPPNASSLRSEPLVDRAYSCSASSSPKVEKEASQGSKPFDVAVEMEEREVAGPPLTHPLHVNKPHDVEGERVEERERLGADGPAARGSVSPTSTGEYKETFSGLAGIEPTRPGVRYSEMSLGLLGFAGIDASYASFHRVNTNSDALYEKAERGDVPAARELRGWFDQGLGRPEAASLGHRRGGCAATQT